MTVHPAAAEGFDQGAAAYERGRPGYPQAAVDWIVAHLGIDPQSRVLDLGAGTGKFTRLLMPTGARIVALEPVAGMREELARVVPGIEILEGTAEAIPLLDGGIDAVVAAQAFHWFATGPAVSEIHRVLAPAGGLALIWNRRDLRDPLQRALDDIVRPHRGLAPAHEWDRWREAMVGNPKFKGDGERQFHFEQTVDQDGAIDRVLSTSFIASMNAEQRAAIAERVRAIVPAADAVVLRYLTDVFLFRRV
jgi:SAM-dependent methyltransferase